MKTGTDAGAQQIDLVSPTANLIALQPPNPIPRDTRVTATETNVFVINATLTDYKLEGGS